MQWRLNESTRAYVEETMRETAALQARLTALEAAARVALGHWVNDEGVCWTCRHLVGQGGTHDVDCWVGGLAALLEET